MEQLRVGGESYGFHKLDDGAARLPYTLRILLENVLRNGSDESAEAVSGWIADAQLLHTSIQAEALCRSPCLPCVSRLSVTSPRPPSMLPAAASRKLPRMNVHPKWAPKR